MLLKRHCNAGSTTSVRHPAGCKHVLDVALLADGDGALLPVANDLATEVVLRLAIVSAVEGREEVLLEALEVLDGLARTEYVIDVGGHYDVQAVAAARRPSPD
eukprot:2380552-Rhodomonas_salina.1